MSRHVIRVIAGADGRPRPTDGTYVVAYDPRRPPAPVSAVPDGALTSEHCLLVLHPDPRHAMRADRMAHFTRYRAECPCGTPQPSGRVCRPLTAYTVSIEPEPS